MKTTVVFGIGCSEISPRNIGGDVTLKDAKSFRRVVELTGQSPRHNPGFLILIISAHHTALPEVFRLIQKETGRIPIPHRKMGRNGEAAKYFSVQVRREYEEEDVRDLPYARVHCRREIADFKRQSEDEHYVARADKRLKAHWEYGNLAPFPPAYAINTRLKEVLERERMKGFRPRPVLFDKPEKATKELWQPWSGVFMPTCLLPLVDDVGEPATQDNLADPIEYTDRVRDPGRGVWYECGSYYWPEELCYNATAIAELGDFDIALGRERVGFTKGGAFRALIISQRFRQVLKKQKLSGMQYVPVRLRKKGEPLWENPFENIIGPYEEKPPIADR